MGAGPKPNPLGERTRRGSSVQDEEAQPVLLARQAVAVPPQPRAKRIDTSALTGLRGLAALHVAMGHYFGMSTLRQDLIGGAAMPFFFLLSGFVMTLGYGQSEYSSAGGCCSCSGDDGGGPGALKVMDKSKFWRNRLARLYPVYFVTNMLQVGLALGTGGDSGQGLFLGLNGSHQGLIGSILTGICTLLGINSWLFPFIDVGMPPNGVTWTITTMTFFYAVFPWMLPRMQALTPAQRGGLSPRATGCSLSPTSPWYRHTTPSLCHSSCPTSTSSGSSLADGVPGSTLTPSSATATGWAAHGRAPACSFSRWAALPPSTASTPAKPRPC
jgi:hypothetical protein